MNYLQEENKKYNNQEKLYYDYIATKLGKMIAISNRKELILLDFENIFSKDEIELTKYEINDQSINWMITLYLKITEIEDYLVNFVSRELYEIQKHMQKKLDKLILNKTKFDKVANKLN